MYKFITVFHLAFISLKHNLMFCLNKKKLKLNYNYEIVVFVTKFWMKIIQKMCNNTLNN